MRQKDCSGPFPSSALAQRSMAADGEREQRLESPWDQKDCLPLWVGSAGLVGLQKDSSLPL